MQIFNKEREKKNPKHEQISRNENVTNNNNNKKKQLTMDTHGNQTLNTWGLMREQENTTKDKKKNKKEKRNKNFNIKVQT